jgi:internalin A
MSTQAQLQALLSFPLQATPLQGRNPAWAVMPCLHNPAKSKEKSSPWQALYLENNGRLSGLNLAGQGLSDADWAKIYPLLDLENLEALNLRGNQLTHLPGLERMHKLQYLDLCNNKLEDLQFSPAAENLQHVFLSGNPHLKNPPPEVVARGRFAIAEHLRDIRAQGGLKLYEAKVLILGAGGAGKTTLLRKLLDGIGADMPDENESTQGIDVKDHTFSCAEDQTFTAHLWDFGGQEIYHSTHQFFLTTRSLYVVVIDLRKEEDYSYWLQFIELLGGNSPVILVQNEKSGRGPRISFGQLQDQFPQLKSTHSLDLSKDKDKLNKLKKDIEETLIELEHVGADWPANRVNLRRKLQEVRAEKQKPFISLKKYLKYCLAFGQDQIEALKISRDLHDLGAILHFQNLSFLNKTVILDSEWATDGVYQVLDSRKVQDSRGYFSRQDALDIWADTSGQHYRAQHVEMADELLELMRKFEICYRLNETEEAYLAPQMLSEEQPEKAQNWKPKGALQLRYEYDFMPKGIIARLVVRLHRYLEDDRHDAWQAGAIFKRGKSTLLLEEMFKDPKGLHLQAIGPDARDLRNIVMDEIDNLHKSYPKFLQDENAVRKKVPCICPKCEGSETPSFFPYNMLLSAKEQNAPAVQCQLHFQMVNVDKLLHDFQMERRLFRSMDDLDKQAIRQKLSEDKIEEAIQFFSEESEEYVNFMGRYIELKTKDVGDSLKREDYVRERNKLRSDISDSL